MSSREICRIPPTYTHVPIVDYTFIKRIKKKKKPSTSNIRADLKTGIFMEDHEGG